MNHVKGSHQSNKLIHFNDHAPLPPPRDKLRGWSYRLRIPQYQPLTNSSYLTIPYISSVSLPLTAAFSPISALLGTHRTHVHMSSK